MDWHSLPVFLDKHASSRTNRRKGFAQVPVTACHSLVFGAGLKMPQSRPDPRSRTLVKLRSALTTPVLVQVDLLDFSGPDFRHVDNRVAALRLVQKNLCDAALFDPQGGASCTGLLLYPGLHWLVYIGTAFGSLCRAMSSCQAHKPAEVKMNLICICACRQTCLTERQVASAARWLQQLSLQSGSKLLSVLTIVAYAGHLQVPKEATDSCHFCP